HKGAQLKVPGFFKFVIKYVTPLYMLAILGVWTYQDAVPKLLMHDEAAENVPFLWAARGLMLAIIALNLWLISKAWQRKKGGAIEGEEARPVR
ncbi:MAG: hypothetical protein ACXWFJ_03955, partial [Candidatus Aminicenantales bacterium]